MARAPRYAAIDIGTTKVCTLVGHVNDTGEVEIAGVGVAPARGLQKGMVVNIEEASDAIRTSVHRAERTSGVRISSAHVGITGNHLNSANHRGTITLSHSDRLVSEEDVARVFLHQTLRLTGIAPEPGLDRLSRDLSLGKRATLHEAPADRDVSASIGAGDTDIEQRSILEFDTP